MKKLLLMSLLIFMTASCEEAKNFDLKSLGNGTDSTLAGGTISKIYFNGYYNLYTLQEGTSVRFFERDFAFNLLSEEYVIDNLGETYWVERNNVKEVLFNGEALLLLDNRVVFLDDLNEPLTNVEKILGPTYARGIKSTDGSWSFEGCSDSIELDDIKDVFLNPGDTGFIVLMKDGSLRTYCMWAT